MSLAPLRQRAPQRLLGFELIDKGVQPGVHIGAGGMISARELGPHSSAIVRIMASRGRRSSVRSRFRPSICRPANGTFRRYSSRHGFEIADDERANFRRLQPGTRRFEQQIQGVFVMALGA